MDINLKFQNLRVRLRQNSKKIIDDALVRHLPKASTKHKSKVEICIFCGSKTNLTKEHVIPKWTFEKSPEKFFITGMNGSKQTYNKTTVPACSSCNNDLLANIENYIVNLFESVDLSKYFFSSIDVENIIRWLEIIEYKFQILEIRRKFNKHISSKYIGYIADIPISLMRDNIISPAKAMCEIRKSQKRVTEKSKYKKTNSLLIFKTTNKVFHFFHQMNDYIFIELPQFEIALFYFYTQEFEESTLCHNKAMEIIQRVY